MGIKSSATFACHIYPFTSAPDHLSNHLLTQPISVDIGCINEINSAYFDLQRSQAAIKGYLSSAVELKEQQELVAKKLGVLTKSKEVMEISLKANDVLSEILRGTKEADATVDEFLGGMKETKENIEKIISGETKK